MLQQTDTSTNLKDFLVDLSEYFNDSGYAISPARISYSYEELKGAEENDYANILKPLFCSNKNQYVSFSDIYKKYFEQKEHHKKLKEKHKEIQDQRNGISQKLSMLDKEQAEEIKKLPPAGTVEVPKTKENLLQKEKKLLNEAVGKELTEKLLNKEYIKISDSTYNQALQDILALAQAKLLKNKIEDYQKLTKLFDAIEAIRKACNKADKTQNEQVMEIRKKYEQKRIRMQNQIRQSEEEQKRIQKELEEILDKESRQKVVLKEAALSHRAEFRGGNSVQLLGGMDSAEFNKDFDKLSEKEKNTIKAYLKENLLYFKTKLTRNIRALEKQKVDMLGTIQQACRTGGMPVNIIYEKKKPSKTKLVLILDISGSCKDASSMMLTFMHMLNSVFPRGISTYAFVNKLYDISPMLQTSDIDKAIQNVFAKIPTRGIYSNYTVPLKQLWNDHRHDLSSDSIVIFMGDARNNHNDPAYGTLKNICRKAKKAYWLNTEDISKWDYKDSLASGYAKYAKMYEVVNIKELIGFIQSGIR